ncbi:hypothetical protein TNCV_2164041 [Trichonephila clavipes]|nr:hypothetical protein TNCV_2164041 [Trichonephila clavipes]
MLLRRREAGSEPAPVNRLVISSADSNTGSFGIPKTIALGLVLQLGVPWVNWRITSRTYKTVSKTSTPKPSHKKRIERLKDSKVLQNKRRRSNLSKKNPPDLRGRHVGSTWFEDDESLMGDPSPTLPISSSKQGAFAKNS